jgi:hypothetical protein
MPERTTIVLDDELMHRLRALAAQRRTGLSRTISDLVRAGLKRSEQRECPAYSFDWPTFRGRLMPGVDVDDRDRLYEVMEGRS